MNSQNKWISFLSKTCFILLFIFLTLPKAWAGSIFEFKPTFSTQVKYDDNIFLDRSSTRSDWITTLSPGFNTSLSNPRFNYELEYHPGFVYYLHNPEIDYTSHDVRFNTTMELTSRLTFSLYERYRRSNQIDFEEMTETDHEREVRRRTLTTFNRNVVAPKIEYHFGRENLISFYYRNTCYRGGKPLDDDYRESYLENEIEYWFNTKNAISIRSHFTKGNFDIEPDLLHSIDITARYIRRFTPHFQIYGEYSWGETDFEERRYFQNLDDRREFQVRSEDIEDYDL